MRSEYLPFSRPAIGEEEIEAVNVCLRSGWLTSGPRVLEFEETFAARVGARHAVAFSSATAAFQALFQSMRTSRSAAGSRAVRVRRGDGTFEDSDSWGEVLCPSLTWPSPINMASLFGGTPVFVDIDSETLLVDPASMLTAATNAAAAFIYVHFAGRAANLEGLRERAGASGTLLIEDAAHALGASCEGKPVGCGGNPTVFSFHPTKNITCGEGGMVALDDEATAAELRRLRFHGIEQDTWQRHGRRVAAYDVAEPGVQAQSHRLASFDRYRSAPTP